MSATGTEVENEGRNYFRPAGKASKMSRFKS
jgi:hypothetical protein